MNETAPAFVNTSTAEHSLIPMEFILFIQFIKAEMFRNYLKIAWRNLWKNKVFSLLNISGLAVGMAVAMIIALWAINEFSYDRFLPNSERIYQLQRNVKIDNELKTVPYLSIILSDVLRKEVPEIKYVTETTNPDEKGLKAGDKKLQQKGTYVGSDFLKMFQYPLLKGNAANALKDAYSIVLSESTAKALFGDADPMGKQVRLDNENDLTVTGILKDVPENATIRFNFLIPTSYLIQTSEGFRNPTDPWMANGPFIYVELQKNADEAVVARKIKNIIMEKSASNARLHPELIMHPLKKWHLYSEFKNGKSVGGYISYVYMFGTIGLLVLLIACINFMNLSTARSVKRAKEVGVRKAIGSYRSQLIVQFLSESVLLAFISFCFSLLIVGLSLPFFNALTGTTIHIPFASPLFWCIVILYLLLTGLLAGSRPAFYLSAFNPVQVLKGTIQSKRSAGNGRKVLVVVQFSCSVALIISTFIIYQQIQHVKNRPVGYDFNRLLMTRTSDDLYKNYVALKNELLKTGMVESVAKSSSPLDGINHYPIIENWPGKKESDMPINTGNMAVSDNYFETVGMKIKMGRNFLSSDTACIIVNETAIKEMGLKEPLNQVITVYHNEVWRIVGVVENSILESPYTPVVSTLFKKAPEGSDYGFIFYRIKPTVKTEEAIAVLEKIFNKYNPTFPYSFTFVDEDYNQKFKLEMLVGKLASILSGLAIFISCLGLFGLAAYTAEQRTKEIGVRKVLGASVIQLWMLLCKDFIVLVLISSIIASPLAFYFLQGWLQNYEYHISIAPWVFVVGAFIGLIITMITISFQAIKAAIANPVKNLRTE
ncbi:MAG TPA: ABC transporter permease [Bacteroidia bacterium]|nr:ABC transporter permease [Bacteroidia bacterium]